MSIIEKIMQAVEDTMVEAEVDFPAGREAGPRIEYDSDSLRSKIEAVLSLTTKETFSGTVDADTPLMAAAREAGWALMELVDEIDWTKRDQVSDIIGQLGVALSESEAKPVVSIVPSHCSASALVFDRGSIRINKDGSGEIVVAEADFVLEDDRCEGPDGPGGSVYWAARIDPSEVSALRDFLKGVPAAPEAPHE